MSTPKRIPAICQCGCDRVFLAIEYDVKRGYGKYLNHAHSARKQNFDGVGWPGRKGKPKSPVKLNSFLSPGSTL